MTLPPLNVIGKSENHDQHGIQIVTGKADYAGDRLPNVKLYGALKLAKIAHGTIKSIDTSRALSLPGVKAVITYNDCPIWSENIFFWGQEVAGVVADDPHTAIRATMLIDIQYQSAPAVTDPDKAMDEKSPLSGVLPGVNSRLVTNLARGDVIQGMKRADLVVETKQPWSTSYQHNTLEPHQAIAWWIGDDLYFWAPAQHIHSIRNSTADTLGLPTTRVHAFTHFTGCAHGDKTGTGSTVIASIMSRAVGGLPVHFSESRRDNIIVNTRQFAVRSDITLGAQRDGQLAFIDASFWADGGRNATAPFGNVHYGLRTTYRCGNAKFKVTGINTNSPPRGFWRCVNDPPGAVNYDVAMDKLAYKLQIDPLDFRLKNLNEAEAPDQDAPFLVWSGTALKECFISVREASLYDSKHHKPGGRFLPDGRLHGIAITGHIDSHGSVSGDARGAIITMNPDGTSFLNIGGARGSEGGPTTCCHIVAEVMGMKYPDVKVGDWGCTDTSLDAGMQAGSTFTASAGSAFYSAAHDLKSKLFSAALAKPPFQGADIGDLDASESIIYLKRDPSKKLTYRQVMQGTPPLAGTGNGWGRTLRIRSVGTSDIGSPCNCTGDSATCAEVAIDPETGEVEILGLWNTVDTGRTIFKQGATKEMLSGAELMIGQALFYGDTYDPHTGAILNNNFTESSFPTTLDFNQDRFYVTDIESNDSAGPFGAHGIGEPCVSNYSAIICAIFNASGKWVDQDKGACSPDKVLESLRAT
jgi:CO/xanthine dehydrogenase Mo-binding subunit